MKAALIIARLPFDDRTAAKTLLTEEGQEKVDFAAQMGGVVEIRLKAAEADLAALTAALSALRKQAATN